MQNIIVMNGNSQEIKQYRGWQFFFSFYRCIKGDLVKISAPKHLIYFVFVWL